MCHMIACEILAVSSRNGVLGLRSLRKCCVKHEMPSGKHVFPSHRRHKMDTAIAGRCQAGFAYNCRR